MERFEVNNGSRRLWAGIVIVLIGFVFLLDNLGFNFPHWIFGWYTFLIVIGVYLGAKRNFTGSGWLIMVIIGIYFNLEAMPFFGFNFSKYALGIGIVFLGLYLIAKPKGSLFCRRKIKNQPFDSVNNNLGPNAENTANSFTSNDAVEIFAFFGGSNQTVYSKDFKGGNITAFFGGADVNFVQSDFKEVVKINVGAVFGGIKLIVPHNWAIKSNVTALFGSVEDKRPQVLPNTQIEKTLVLEGVAMFGGVEVKSY